MAGNPYQAPRAHVSDVESEEYGEVRMWSASGRLGRLRYLAYLTGAWLVCGFIVGFLRGLAGPVVGLGVGGILYIVALVLGIMVAIQRSHDMDWSGWTVLLMLIPLAGFIWMFAPGTKGVNSYGAPPPPNTTGVTILGLLLPIISLIAIVAAIAIPAYVEYARRAAGG